MRTARSLKQNSSNQATSSTPDFAAKVIIRPRCPRTSSGPRESPTVASDTMSGASSPKLKSLQRRLAMTVGHHRAARRNPASVVQFQ